MRIKRCENHVHAMRELQKYIDSNPVTQNRRIFKSNMKDSYDDKQYHMEMWVVEGSAPKLIVIINVPYGKITCMDIRERKLIKFTWDGAHIL